MIVYILKTKAHFPQGTEWRFFYKLCYLLSAEFSHSSVQLHTKVMGIILLHRIILLKAVGRLEGQGPSCNGVRLETAEPDFGLQPPFISSHIQEYCNIRRKDKLALPYMGGV